MNKILIVLSVLILIAAVVYVQMGPEGVSVDENETPATSSAVLAGSNAIFVAAQEPGSSVRVTMVALSNNGYVVLHKVENNAPGEIIATSGLLQEGSTDNVEIVMPNGTQIGEQYFAMLHTDNGDGEFNAAEDQPATNDDGAGPVMMKFDIVEDAEEAGIAI